MNKMTDKIIIGRTDKVDFEAAGIVGVPAKVDTGADTSSVWATRVHVDEDGVLSFILLGKASKLYNGRVITTKRFKVVPVRNSSGHWQLRYSVKLAVRIHDRLVNATFTLANRSMQQYPVLIGCKLLKGRFLVDVEQGDYVNKRVESTYARESAKDPRKFFEEYFLKRS